jgi:hypothetical protein
VAKHSPSLLIVFGAVVIFASLLVHAQNSSPTKVYTLSKVTYAGSKRFTQAQLLAASGLRVGQKLTLQGVDDASTKLFKTGVLSRIGYNFSFVSDAITVVFDVADATKFLPCHYDNLIWFTDAELTAAVQKEIPLFDGSLPEKGDLSDQVSAAIDRILSGHRISGSTLITPEGVLNQPLTSYRVVVTGIQIPVVSVNVTGGPLGLEMVANSIRLLTSGGYSRSSAHAAAVGGMTESYQNEGYLQVQFAEPVVTMKDPQHVEATQGVTLSYAVTPGPLYIWGGVDWTGNQGNSSTDLTSLTGMKPGDTARLSMIKHGWDAIRENYGHSGHLAVTLTQTPEFDVVQHTVHYRVNIAEGAVFKMGELHITGVAEPLASTIKGAWKLLPGQVYDTSYVRTFFSKDMPAALKASGGSGALMPPLVVTTTNTQKLVVDVNLTFH